MPRTVPQQPPNPRAQATTYPAAVVERLARTVAGLSAASVAVIGDQPGLSEALAARGVVLGSVESGATMAIVRCDVAPAGEVLAGVGTPRVFAWQPGDLPMGGYVRDAAASGYFRSTRRLPQVRGASCVLLDAGESEVDEIVSRYETILDGGPDLEKELQELRHQLLASRDRVLGTEAELARVRSEQRELNNNLGEIYGTTTWRIGRAVVAPLGRAKRALRK